MDEEVDQLRCSGIEFAFDMFEGLRTDDNSNVLVSPATLGLTVHLAIASCKAIIDGNVPEESSEDQPTNEEPDESSDSDQDYQPATKFYLKSEMPKAKELQKFIQTNSKFDVETVTFDEETRMAINTWVESKTNANNIKDVIGEDVFTDLTRIVLANAVHFKWEAPFDASSTFPEEFYVDAESTVTVDMMHNQADFYFAVSEELKCQLLAVPYVDKDLLMYIILPDERDGLPELESEFTLDALVDLIGSASSEIVNVAMPKFRMHWIGSLEKLLFHPNFRALFGISESDLSGMTVIHKSVIEVNEGGSNDKALCSKGIHPNFHVDHPFLVMIHDKRDNTILFLGRVVHPLE